MSSDTLAKFEILLSLKEEFVKLKDPLCSKLSKAITEKTNVQLYLTKVSQALKALENEVEMQMDENDLSLAEMCSLLEKIRPSGQQQLKDGGNNVLILADLLSLLGECKLQDSRDTLHTKLKQSLAVSFILN